ncbi:hypothetical protein [Streptomyces sp. NPDC050738]|uniref:hypothetical protein n=1 Tax=Streptomyces sp. NPDC050738 TaxID=3154744 RepID=UPI003443D30C
MHSPPAPAPWRPSPYFLVGGLFWALMTAATWRVPMAGEFGTHAAVVERLSADWLHPTHPLAALPGEGSPYYSPYALFQGLFAHAMGLPGRLVVKLSTPVNLLVLLTGIGRFSRLLTPRRWAPVFALAAMVLLWGTEPAGWSGSFGLLSMTTTLAYPSAFAAGLALHIWALTGSAALEHERERTGYLEHAALGVLIGLLMLIHPITSVGALVGVAAFVAGWQREWDDGTARRWSLTVVAAVAVAASWPYFNAFTLGSGETSALLDQVQRGLYDHIGGRFWLGLLGVPALWVRWRRSRRDPLVLMFAADCLLVAYGWISGHYTYGRLLGLTLVGPQFALAVELARPGPRGLGRRLLAPVAVAAAALGFFTVQAGAVVPRSLDPVGFDQPPDWRTYEWVTRYVEPGETVLADDYFISRSLPGYGAYLVAPTWPDPALSEKDRLRRKQDVHRYLSPLSTATVRADIARRYRVHWLLLTPRQSLPPEAVAVAFSPVTGEVLARVPEFRL